MPFYSDMPAILAHHAKDHGEHVAFVEGERSVTYAEFANLVARTAAWLAAHGIGPDDRVAVWLVNRLEWLALYFALSHLGAGLITVSTRYRAHELAHVLRRAKPKMLVLEPRFRTIDFLAVLAAVDLAATASLRSVVVVERGQETAPKAAGHRPLEPFRLADLPDANVAGGGSPDSLNLVFTTSGTTSGPKLVAHSQRTIATHSQHVANGFGLREKDVKLLVALPLCGVFGLNGALGAFAAGAPVVLMETFDAQPAAELVHHHRITHMFGSDEMFWKMLDCVRTDPPFPSARLFGFAAFHPGAEQRGTRAARRGVPMCGLYGSSEVQALFSVNDTAMPLPERLKGGGLPCNPGAEIRVRDVESGAILPDGESGLIEIRADTNFIGYLDDAQATRQVVDNAGFFATGDVGFRRKDGSFVYETRRNDAIRLAGFLVSPGEIEDLLKRQPGILDAQVVGVELEGRSRCAGFVVMAEGAALDEGGVRSALAAMLAPHKVPVHVWAIEGFPTTSGSNGTKIQRQKLRDMAAKRLEALPR